MKQYVTFFILLLFATNSLAQSPTGCVSGNCDDGYGKYVWTSGDVYVGEWKNGKRNGEGTYYYPNGEKYIGAYKDDKREGFGTFTWASGNSYSGQWMQGEKHGEGTYYYLSGKKQSGIWSMGEYEGKTVDKMKCIYGNCDNGVGTYMWPTGEKYTGKWLNYKRNGQGTNYFADGRIYEGEWKDDDRHGYGKQTEVDGTIKAGMWENDRFIGTATNNYGCISGNCNSGYGIYTWDTGDKYEGYFVNAFREGYGKYTWADGATHEGYWKNGQQHGTGTYTNAAGAVTKGQWSEGKFVESSQEKIGCISGNCENGFGTKVYTGGNKYSGSFKNGKLSGQGTYYHSNGDEYVGEFAYGTYNGVGTYTFSDGKKYVGDFADGTYNGKGTMFYTDGTKKSGIWKDGKFISGSDPTQKPPVISWIEPSLQNTTTTASSVNLKVCVNSETDLEQVKYFLNDKLIANNTARGFTVVAENCDNTLQYSVELTPGKNELRVEVRNGAGEAKSTPRTINYNPAVSKEKRYALIIGNSDYQESPLRNPANDANAMANALKELGFQVSSYTNIGQNDMKRYIREFGNKLAAEKGIGLFYFAGHGLQLNGENYLVPVDANIQKEQDVEFESVNLKRVMGEMDYAQNDLNIIILDACRNNPFARSFRSSGNQGLASTTAPSGTFIAYATAPGSVASDGVGENGLYTQELLKAIKQPNKKIEDVFKQVRNEVYNKSGKQQVPWENSSIFGDFYFKK